MVVEEKIMEKLFSELKEKQFSEKQPWWLDELTGDLVFLVSEEYELMLQGECFEYPDDAYSECIFDIYELIYDIGKRCISMSGEYKEYVLALNSLKKIDSKDNEFKYLIEAVESQLDGYLDRQLNPAKYTEDIIADDLPF